MQASQAANSLVARAGQPPSRQERAREATGVLSAAQRHTHFLDSPRIVASMARADFRFRDLRDGTATVFLVLPPNRLDAYARWLRLLIAQALRELDRVATEMAAPVPNRPPVLFLLDEFAAIGRMEPIERAMGLMAGLGLQLWPILQDLHQLRALYGARAETFVSNAGLVQVFGVNDIETATWVSRTLGSATQAYWTSSRSRGRSSSGFGSRRSTTTSTGTSVHLTARPLLTPDEVMRLDADSQILLPANSPPVLARKLRCFRDPKFRGLFGSETA